MATTPPTLDSLTIHRLDNGLTLCMEPLPYLRSATAGIWIRTGSANEGPEESGVAHFLEHLFFKGTKTRNVRQLMEAIEGKGGQINAFTSREYTCLYVKMLDEHIATGIEILADIFKNSRFCDVDKERNVVLEEIASIKDTPDEHVHDLLTEYHWPNHALGRPVSGHYDSVTSLTRNHVQAFYDTWYKPGGTFFSIAGHFDEDAVLRQAREELDGLAAAAMPARHAPPAFQEGIHIVDREIAQAHVCLAFPAPTLFEPERYRCEIVNSILGGGSTSRLFDRIREREGLAYAVYTFHSLCLAAGMTGIYAAVAPENYGRTLELIFEELRRLRDEPVSAEELAMNREQIKGNLLMALESTSSRMSRMAKNMMFYGRVIPVDELIRNLEAVTAEDVQAFAQKTFTPEHSALVVLGRTNKHQLDRIPL